VRLSRSAVSADHTQSSDQQQPHLAGNEGAERENFLTAVRCDLEVLREEARRHEKPRQRLVEAAPFVYEALKDGVRKEAILRVLARRGYTGTRAMFLYFLKTHLERELIKQGVTPDGWVLTKISRDAADSAEDKEPQMGLKRESSGKRARRTEKQRETINRLVEQRSSREATVKVFKDGLTKEESEFNRRLAEAIRQRKKSGEWEKV
jgi:hypothetical protein